MTNNAVFNPEWASPPGATIADILNERFWSPEEFARNMACTLNDASALLRSEQAISPQLADKLAAVLGGSAAFWLKRQAQYGEAVAILANAEVESEAQHWLSQLPLQDMRRFGWIPRMSAGTSVLKACLEFFDVPDLNAWYARYSRPLEMAAFRTSASFDSQIGSVAAWLRRGEIESASIECKPWDADGFATALFKIRPLTRKRNPLHFLPELVRLCADSGVAVAIVRTTAGCRASGSTRFITPTKASLMLSFRYLSDDHFWFTFFHEAGHLILHGKKALFIEGDTISSAEETEANEFAARLLVPAEVESDLKHLPIERLAIRRFAKTVGVSPGIVLGQLQYRGLARQNQLNSLKTRFKWSKKSD